MKIENKDFWEKSTVIATQDITKNASDFEQFMFQQSLERQKNTRKIETIKIFGCGTGREIKAIAEFFNPKKIVASDISENMIKQCNENLKLWAIESITETVVGNAKRYNEFVSIFDMVTILNSMLTYVPLRVDRIQIFKNSFQILKPNGTIIGTVHNQVGTKSKTYFFKLRSLFSFILKEKVGNRNTGFNGFKVSGYYYNKKGLEKDLSEAGFINCEIYSLEEYYALRGKVYNRKAGYNNLIFIASKP